MVGDAVRLTDDMDIAQARATLERAGAAFAVVTSSGAEGGPLAVIEADDLAELAEDPATGAEPLAVLAHRFRPLVSVDAEPDELTAQEFYDLAELLGREPIRGVLVEREGQPAAVIPRSAMAAALDLEPQGNVRFGPPDVASLRFVCRKCSPPSFRMPRAVSHDGEPPTCRRVYFHGRMEPDEPTG